MKILNFIIFALIISCHTDEKDNNNADQIKSELTIYDKDGIAVAYCNYSNKNETIIYLWNGKPTCYYTSENDDLIYGFNGKFIGWRKSGIYYDLNGKRIGFEKNAINIITYIENVKHIKEIPPIKTVIEFPPQRQFFSVEWSKMKLDSFYLKGRE